MSLEEQIMSKDKYATIFSRKIEAIVFKYFATRVKTFLRKAYCFLRGMFSVECSLVRLYE